jgi:hypothetical protein
MQDKQKLEAILVLMDKCRGVEFWIFPLAHGKGVCGKVGLKFLLDRS